MNSFFCSDKGIVYSARAYKIPECTRTAAGTPLVQVLCFTLNLHLLVILSGNSWSFLYKFFNLISIFFPILGADLIFNWWWENNICYSCEWFCWRSVFIDAHHEWLCQESIFEFFLIHQVNWNHCNSAGLFSCFMLYSCILINDCLCNFISRPHTLTWQVPRDELKWVRCCTNDDLVAMASQNGMVTLTSCETVCYISYGYLNAVPIYIIFVSVKMVKAFTSSCGMGIALCHCVLFIFVYIIWSIHFSLKT